MSKVTIYLKNGTEIWFTGADFRVDGAFGIVTEYDSDGYKCRLTHVPSWRIKKVEVEPETGIS